MEKYTFHGQMGQPTMALFSKERSTAEVRTVHEKNAVFVVFIEYVLTADITISFAGVHTWADGRVYIGHFENGKESGFGTLTHPDGVKYRGQFNQGVKEGYGIMLWKTRTYDGEWYVKILLPQRTQYVC
jgi:hypothetical protein